MPSSTVSSQIIWTDNFDDDNLDDWNIASYSMTCENTCPWVNITSSISVEEGELVIDKTFDGVGISWATRDANVSYGKWSR